MERKHIAGPCLLGLAMLLSCGVAGAQMYKWTDARGVVHFSDTPPATKGDKVELKTYGAGAAASPLPYALAQAAANHPVTLYTSASCGPCDQGRTLLRQRGVPFAEKTIGTAADQQKLKEAGSDGQLPLLIVGRTKLTGFQGEAWNEALTVAAYPAQSMLPSNYQQAAAAPAAPPQQSPQALAQARAAEREAAAQEQARFAPRPPPKNGTPDFQF
jgi:glutaredoxin